MRVLVTRPAGDAEDTAALLKARGHEPLLAPLLAVRFHDGHPLHLDDVQALLFTSANGVRAFARRSSRRDFPAFAVGSQTAQAARDVGFADVRNADGDAKDLAQFVRRTRKPEDGPLLHAAGAEAEGRLARMLTDAGYSVRTQVLYDVPNADALPAAARDALAAGTLDAILLFSTRSATAFVDLVGQAGLRDRCAGLVVCCISEAAARPLSGLTIKDIRIAARPSQGALLDCLG
jgi:uroporphyrinogen-III synthase